jgi:hypothetical protein
VVEHQLGDHAHPALMGGVEEALEVLARAVVFVDVGVVGDVVPAVLERRRVERQQPQRRDPEVAEVIEALDHPVDVANAVIGRILERANVQLVDDRVFEPQRIVGKLGRLDIGHKKYSN